jgi:hypothetical protein
MHSKEATNQGKAISGLADNASLRKNLHFCRSACILLLIDASKLKSPGAHGLMSDLQVRITALATMHTQHHLTRKMQTTGLGRFSAKCYGMTVQIVCVSETTVNDVIVWLFLIKSMLPGLLYYLWWTPSLHSR